MPRIAQSSVTTTVTPRGFVPRPADTSAIGKSLMNLGTAFEQKKEREDLSYLAGQKTKALLDWDDKKRELQAEYGSDSRQAVEEFNDYMGNYIATISNEAPNAVTAQSLNKTLGSLQFSSLKDALTERNKAFQATNSIKLDQDTDLTLGMVKNDWPNAEKYYLDGMNQINAALWLPENERIKKAFEFEAAHRQQVISGWFSSNTNKLSALQQLKSGDSPVSVYFNQLGLEEKETTFNKLLSQELQETRLFNSIVDKEEKLEKDRVNSLLLQFYDFQNPDVDRQNIINNIKVSGQMDPDRLLKMQEIIAGRDIVDNPTNRLIVESLIQSGEIRSVEQLVNDSNFTSISSETISKRLVPMVQAYQDKDFTAAERLVKNAIGLPETFDLYPERRTKEQKDALNRLIMYRAQNPGGNYMDEANAIISEYEDQKRKVAPEKLNALQKNLESARAEYRKKPTPEGKRKIDILQRQIEDAQ